MIQRAAAILMGAALIAGCARTPDVKLGYHVARAEMSVRVMRTIICDDAHQPVIITAVAPTVVHAADLKRGQLYFAIKPIASDFANADIKIERWDDGRVKAINATSTGQGEAIVKAIASVIPLIPFDNAAQRTFSEQCAFIKASGGGKPFDAHFRGSSRS